MNFQKLFILFVIPCFLFSSCNTVELDICTESCFIESGISSWYGHDYPERCTANGETYNPQKYTAAHKTLPFNTIVRVDNLDNGKSVTVRINDRGPFVEGRVIDLSKKAADDLDILTVGLADVEIYLVKESENPEPDYNQSCLDI
ncbi:MAG: septal ring lytic transglycosylase RlpA family protein [Balneolaceae bacterium]